MMECERTQGSRKVLIGITKTQSVILDYKQSTTGSFVSNVQSPQHYFFYLPQE